jgi:hypothetical protein
MKPKHLFALLCGLSVTMTIGGQLITRLVAPPAPQISPATVTPAPPRTVVIVPVPSAPTSTTTTTLPDAPKTAHDALQADLSTLIAPDTPCQEWAPLALEVGWPADELVNVLEEMWQESRCLNIIPGDPRWNGGDHGLMQINTVWKEEVEHLFGSWERIDDPAVNLAMALEIWRWHDAHRSCGWEPWNRPC